MAISISDCLNNLSASWRTNYKFMPNESVAAKNSGKIRKIVVNRDACIGARSCSIVAAKTFEIDNENLAKVMPDPSQFDDDDTIKRGAEACPVLCIHLYDADGNKIFPN